MSIHYSEPNGLDSALYGRILSDAQIDSAPIEEAAVDVPGNEDAVLVHPLVFPDFPDKLKVAVHYLGVQIVAAASEETPKEVNTWMENNALPEVVIIRRVCLLATVSDYLAEADNNGEVPAPDGPVPKSQNFFLGAHPITGGKSPIEVLTLNKSFRGAAQLIAAAALTFVE